MISVQKEILPINIKFTKIRNLKNVLKLLGNPQSNLKVIHVVGTNGKGSTSNVVSKTLLQKYKKVGLFISPAFLYHNERIQINNIPISDIDLNNLIKQNNEIIKEYNLNFFEIWTLIMILYFNENKVDIAVIEAGIGGELDSTNVFINQIAILLTSISLDHTDILGDSIESIIDTKIKIANPKAPIFVSLDNIKYKNQINSYKNILWAKEYDEYLGYQTNNYGLAKTFLDYQKLDTKNIKSIKPNLGRMTKIIYKNKSIYLDGAHNIGGIQSLIKSINWKLDNVLFSSIEGKNAETSLLNLKKHFPNVYITEFDFYKSWKISDNLKKDKYINNWKEFIDNFNDDILICGSLYFISEVYSYLIKKG